MNFWLVYGTYRKKARVVAFVACVKGLTWRMKLKRHFIHVVFLRKV